ncbi:MAG: hypothetical protein FWD26_04805 [Treponema sp.]|nr:hypothetical protein [Treponema sp.]
MKHIIVIFTLLAFILIGCNEPGTGGDGGGSDIQWNVDYFAAFDDSQGNYPGIEIDLTDSPEPILDISNYGSVTVNATLYIDDEGETIAEEQTGEFTNLAFFKLLKVPGGTNWDDEENYCADVKWNMNVDGDSTLNILDGDTGIPTTLLIQANWSEFEDGVRVKSIRVNSITFATPSDEIVIDLGGTYGFGSNGGALINLNANIQDMSNYALVVVVASLYKDEACTEPITDQEIADAAAAQQGLAHFNLLKEDKQGGWEDSDNRIFSTHVWNMKNGENSKAVVNETGVPNYLLVASSGGGITVRGVKVESITFVPKAVGVVVLDLVYGSDLAVSGNTITFTNANHTTYNSGAAIYFFDSSVLPLTGKTVSVSYTIVNYVENPLIEHQLVIQASCGKGGSEVNHSSGQRYPVLEETGVPTGTFTLDGTALQNAGSGFPLVDGSGFPAGTTTAFRIINNGGTKEVEGAPQSETNKLRNVTYILRINSVTVN